MGLKLPLISTLYYELLVTRITLQVTFTIHSYDSLRSETFFQYKSGKLTFRSKIPIFHISAVWKLKNKNKI